MQGNFLTLQLKGSFIASFWQSLRFALAAFSA